MYFDSTGGATALLSTTQPRSPTQCRSVGGVWADWTQSRVDWLSIRQSYCWTRESTKLFLSRSICHEDEVRWSELRCEVDRVSVE